jgi:ABC-type Na+ efflux pump permease subunit
MRLRLDKIEAIVRKELAEYRKNRYILATLIGMPLLMSIVLPIIYLVPVAILAPPTSNQPLDLSISVEGALSDQQLVNVSIANYRLENVELVNCAIGSSEIVNCTLQSCVVSYSNITGCHIEESILKSCNIWTSAAINTINPGSIFIGVESGSEQYLKLMTNSLLLFFMLIPSVLPTVIASYSFVGEKLSKSLEPLLATPTTDFELLVGKTMAILLPTLAVTWLSVIPTIIITDLVTQPFFGYYPLPNGIWLVGVFLAAPLFAVLSVLANVVVSSKVTDVRSSQQIGGVIVLPAIMFFIISLTGLILLSIEYMLLFSALIFVLDLIVFYLAIRAFKREDILIKWR